MAPSNSDRLVEALRRLKPHDHLCSIYEDPQEHFAVAVPFIRIGLERHEKCLYITETAYLDTVAEALRDGGVDVGAATESGALVLTTKDQTYMRNGRFDPDWMFTFWQQAAEDAAREGFSSLRATGETEWVVRGGPGMERWMEYESRLTRALTGSNACALCQYNRRLFPPELMLDIIRTHPIVIYRDTVCENFYFVPPEEFLHAGRTGREVERMLNNIRERERLDTEIRRAHVELEERVQHRTLQLRGSEERVRHQNAVLEGINRILREALTCDTEEELGRKCLAVAESVTQSRFGFIAEVNEQGRLDGIAISDPGWDACRMDIEPGRKAPQGFAIHGIYGRVLIDGKGFYTNDPRSHPDRIGVPAGHPALTSFLGVPLVHDGKIIGMIAVGNREGGYRDQDLEALTSMALSVVQVFMRKRAERSLREGQERLREAQKMESIGVLAGGIAHDFNNLLVGIIGNASLAQEMLPAGAPSDLLDRVIESGEQAAHLTRQLLAYAGKGQFVREPVDLSALVEKARALVQSCVSKRIAFHTRLEDNLPEIVTDRTQMQQVLMNLVLNANEAIGNNAGDISVATGMTSLGESEARALASWEVRPGPYVFLEVRDSGCGMDEATQARAFEPFFTTKFQGRGLGLAATAGIVRAHHGAVKIASAPGRGTSVVILLPAPASAEAAAPRDHGTATVLLVDDEKVVRDMAKASLERIGYRVLAAEDGRGAITAFAREADRIALVILDLSMPGLGGEETLSEIRRLKPDAAVVLSSGYNEAQVMTSFVGRGVSGFLQKPYTSHTLAKTVAALLK